MRRIPREEKPAEAHRLGHEAAQRGDAFLDGGAGDEVANRLRVEPAPQLVPEAVVRPFLDPLGQRALQVIPAAGRAAHAAKGEAAVVADVDELLGNGLRVRKHAEPAKRVDALESLQRRRGHALAADAVEAVAAGKKIAFDLVRRAVLAVAHARPRAGVEIVHADVLGFVDCLRSRRLARIHEVARDFGLAVDHDVAAGQALEVDAQPPGAEPQLDAIVYQAFGMQAFAYAKAVEHFDRALLEHAGADALEHIILAALLDDQRVDAGLVQQLAEQQPRRPRADDRNLDAHHLNGVRVE